MVAEQVLRLLQSRFRHMLGLGIGGFRDCRDVRLSRVPRHRSRTTILIQFGKNLRAAANLDSLCFLLHLKSPFREASGAGGIAADFFPPPSSRSKRFTLRKKHSASRLPRRC